MKKFITLYRLHLAFTCKGFLRSISLLYKPGIFLAILGRGPRAFQIGKISDVNTKFGKFS